MKVRSVEIVNRLGFTFTITCKPPEGVQGAFLFEAERADGITGCFGHVLASDHADHFLSLHDTVSYFVREIESEPGRAIGDYAAVFNFLMGAVG